MKMSDVTRSEKKLESFEKVLVSTQDMINLRKSFKEEDKDDDFPNHHASKITGDDDADSPKKMGHVRFNQIKFRREKEDVCNEDDVKDKDEDEAHDANDEDDEENDEDNEEEEEEEDDEDGDDDEEEDDDDDEDSDYTGTSSSSSSSSSSSTPKIEVKVQIYNTDEVRGFCER